MDVRLRRSLLYVPAAADAILAKAGTRGADVLVIDLEDSVLPDAKPAARQRVRRMWAHLGGREEFLRINGSGTPWHDDDVAAAVDLRPAVVVLPKCEDPAAVATVVDRLDGLSAALMIETAAGVLAAAALARVPGVAALVLGAADLRKSLRAPASPDETELHVPRACLVLAARAAGIEAFDTPWFDYQDRDGLLRSARRARTLGFDGKTAIHPAQVAPIHEVFTPSASEVAHAEAVIAAIEAAARAGKGVATVGGELVEPLHLAEARRTLLLAAAASAGNVSARPE